jgi:hypothetical protein
LIKLVLLTLSILSSLTITSHAKTTKRKSFYKFQYIKTKNQKIENIVTSFVKDGTKKEEINKSTAKTKSINSKIIKNNSKQEIVIEVYILKPSLDKKKFKAYKTKTKARIKELKEDQQKVIKSSQIHAEGLKIAAFYLATKGKFSQESSSQSNFEQSIESLLSLGLTASFFPKNKKYAFSTSFNYSHIGDVNVDSTRQDSVDIPGEVDFNLYGHYRFSKKNFTLFSGLDYDSFSTFNQGALLSLGNIIVDENKTLYLSLGATKLLKLFGQKIHTRISFAKSISSSTTLGQGAIDSGSSYDGYKSLLYLNYKFKNNLFLHGLFKYHKMTGPDNLDSWKTGLGLGYLIY